MQYPTAENLAKIKVVYYCTGAFVGLPYRLRTGQRPRDIRIPPDEWVWLGSPGWYCDMSLEARALAIAFIEPFREQVRWYEGCWMEVGDLAPAAAAAGCIPR